MNKFSFFSRSPSIYLERTQILNALRNLTISVAFYGKLATLSNLKKFNFFQEAHLFTLKEPKFWTLWEFILFHSHSTANLLPVGIFQKFRIFFEKPISFILFFLKKTKIWMFWDILLFQSHSRAFLLSLAIFKKIKIFFEVLSSFFKKDLKIERFVESYLFSGILRQICYL